MGICRILNANDVKYAVVGAHACALHGHIRATEDYDILVEKSPRNLDLVILTLEELFPDLPEKPTVRDILENVVLKIVDGIELDISIQAWSVDYETAVPDLQHAIIDGVSIPYLGLESLITSKSTAREIDQWDVRVLREIQKRKS